MFLIIYKSIVLARVLVAELCDEERIAAEDTRRDTEANEHLERHVIESVVVVVFCC
jgi:hypothetical protein